MHTGCFIILDIANFVLMYHCIDVVSSSDAVSCVCFSFNLSWLCLLLGLKINTFVNMLKN